MPATRQDFEAVFPQLVKDLKEHCQKYKLPQQALDWFDKVCMVTAHHAKLWLTDDSRHSHSNTTPLAASTIVASPSSIPPNCFCNATSAKMNTSALQHWGG